MKSSEAPDLTRLYQRLGYTFKSASLLDQALTHISAVSGHQARLLTYQRLEFLGDHVLGLVIADLLYKIYPKADEGELSRRFAFLVRHETCAAVAHDMGIGDFLRLGSGEQQSGGARKIAILADVCEAVIAAVYLDGGIEEARKVICRFWDQRVRSEEAHARDAKTALQEWAQSRGLPPPLYQVISREGPDHAPVFRIMAELPGFEPVIAQGASKRVAEQAAAQQFLAHVSGHG